MLKIKIVTVVGVTGTMGANIAGIFASFGNAKVYCVGRDIEKVKRTIPRIVKSVKADAIAKNLIPADFDSLEECVSQSDLIFESSKEDIGVKKNIASRVGKAMKATAVSGTGSSGLSITTIAECYPEELRSRFFGIHMFNPPYQLTLCELTASPYSDMALYGELKEYLTDVLHRTVAESKDLPAFLVSMKLFSVLRSIRTMVALTISMRCWAHLPDVPWLRWSQRTLLGSMFTRRLWIISTKTLTTMLMIHL